MSSLCPYAEAGLRQYAEAGLRPYAEAGRPYGEAGLHPYGETCLSLSLFSRGRDGLMSLASPSDGGERSGSGETQARPKATGLMIDKHALVHYLNEKSFLLRKVAGATMKSKAVGSNLIMNILLSFAWNKL